jgi:hypothetical protein
VNIPNSEDWGHVNRDDLDAAWAFDKFFGLSFVEARALFAKHALYYQEGLSSMPPIPFRFYVRAFADYIASEDSRGDADGALSFLELLLETLKRHRELLDLPCASLLLATARRITHYQESYEANISIYGDFSVCLQQIERAYDSFQQPAEHSKGQ